ncbi:hypothetical protein GCM10018962_42560 [Dactylosporangium matsuzakiense]|uniref:RNA polymerase sigma factor (Sigma-70 family) n=1 Tax=Dactylosporangium matsuzakiense TaxID=53360 RepID=A0A9W6KFV4_9ACTN|nr:hypothetical protein GCM10017581_016650 [Dactylosporangium matsuzakiense]
MTVPLEDLLRGLAPQVLGVLVRRYGQFDACEDAVQQALLAAAEQWPADGVPSRPKAWLVTVAGRALVDDWRTDSARRRREAAAALDPTNDLRDEPDDTLTVLLLCCHPALSPPSQLALTLRAAGGLSTARVAAAFLVPEATMAQRISRAKQRVRDAGARFELPDAAELPARLAVVAHVLYLMFNEGYTDLGQRSGLTAEAIRLARLLHRLRPRDGEAAGLLALMLLTDARRAARTDDDGMIVPLHEQDRSRWDTAAITEGHVDNGAQLPLWERLPPAVYWLRPATWRRRCPEGAAPVRGGVQLAAAWSRVTRRQAGGAVGVEEVRRRVQHDQWPEGVEVPA